MADGMEATARKLFGEVFDDVGDSDQPEGAVCVMAPGRVNLIGEHTDYNDGFVMPLALEHATVAIARFTPDGSSTCRVVSALNPSDVSTFTLDSSSDSLVPGKDMSWARYVKGVVKQYFDEILAAKPAGDDAAVGFEVALASDVPLGGGLSSSASLEVCTALMLETLYGISSVSSVDRALRCVEAEHTFAMMPCGIMDQFISSCAVKGHALLIDCRSHETTPVDIDDPELRILVINSNMKHELTGSEYPDRVRQCKEAVAGVNEHLGDSTRTHLRDITMEELEAANASGKLSEIAFKRARHGVSEDVRTQAAAKAAQVKDYETVGRLMIESHNSLRDDYEVSIPEIDFLVEEACKQDGVFGSRITGGGFGGCTVSLVETGVVDQVIERVSEAYESKFGIKCTCFATKLGDGAHVNWSNLA